MPTFERRHPVSGFYPLLPRTDGGSRCAPNGRPRTRSADVHPAGGRNDVFTMRTALPTSPPPRPVALFTIYGAPFRKSRTPFFGAARTPDRSNGRHDTPESTARVSPAVPSPARPHRSGTSEYEARSFFAARNLSGPSLFPDRAGPASVPSPRTGTGNRPASYLPTLSGRTVSAGRSAGLRLTRTAPSFAFSRVPFFDEAACRLFLSGPSEGDVRLLCRKS